MVPGEWSSEVVHALTGGRASRWLINNNNGYSECLTHTGPKRLHILYMYTLSDFNTYNMNSHTHVCVNVCMHARTHTHTHAHTHTHTHTHTHKHTHIVIYQGNGTEEKVLKIGFQGRFKRTDRGRMMVRNRQLVPDNWSLVRERALTKEVGS